MHGFKEFYQQNRDYVVAYVIVAIICIALLWFLHDHYRNESINDDTDATVERIEERIESASNRLDRVQEANRKSQEAVTGIAESVADSRKQAESIADSVGRTESRIDDATQRLGRIQNLIEEIERANRPGTESSSKTSVAK